MGPRDLPVSQRWLRLERKSGTISLVCPGFWFLNQWGPDFSVWLPPGLFLHPNACVHFPLCAPPPVPPIVSFVLGTLAVQNLDGLSLPHTLRVWDTRPPSH